MPCRIYPVNRIVVAIRKHIAGNGVGFIGRGVGICVDKTMVYRVVISALEVIEPRLGVVVIVVIDDG